MLELETYTQLLPRCLSVKRSRTIKQNQVSLISALGLTYISIQSWLLISILERLYGPGSWGATINIFYFTCLIPGNPDCPPGPNLDADFGEAPMLLSTFIKGTKRDLVVAVQKSGFAWEIGRAHV